MTGAGRGGASADPTYAEHDHHAAEDDTPAQLENFVEDRKQALVNIETRYRSALSFTLGYGWFFGAGPHNLYRDRDFAQAFVKYQF